MSTPPVFLLYQQRWIGDTSPVKVNVKGRRVGLTWCEAGDDSLYSASQGGDDTHYIGYNKEMAREFVDDCAFWARQYELAASEIGESVFRDEDAEKDILVYRIKFDSGHEINALSSRPSNLRGRHGRVVIDEAAFHHDLPGLLKAALALLMWGGSLRIISTHNGDDNPFNELIFDIRAGKLPYSLHSITLDQALEQGLYRRICLRLGREWSPQAEAEWRAELFRFYGDDADEELLCIAAQGGGAYLSRQLIESRMVAGPPVLRLTFKDDFARWAQHLREAEIRDWCEAQLKPVLEKLNPARNHCFGEDFGRVIDLTVIAPMEEGLDLVRRVPFLVELRNVPYEQQKQVLFYIVDRLPRFARGALDARGNGGYLAEVALQRYGERIEAVQLSQEWYRENMPPFKAAFQDAEIELPKDAEVLNDLRAIVMDKGVAKVPETARSKDAKGDKRHGDAGIALALAHYASRGEVIVYDSHRVARQHEDGDPRARDIRNTAGFGLRKGAW